LATVNRQKKRAAGRGCCVYPDPARKLPMWNYFERFTGFISQPSTMAQTLFTTMP